MTQRKRHPVKRISHVDRDTEFLCEFTPQGIERRLPGLTLAPWKLPAQLPVDFTPGHKPLVPLVAEHTAYDMQGRLRVNPRDSGGAARQRAGESRTQSRRP